VEPTRIYVRQLLPLLRAIDDGDHHNNKSLIKAMSHITGGGFTENIPRVLPKHLGCFVDAAAWPRPSVFNWLQRQGGVAPLEMARTFNNGIGMVLVVGAENAERVASMLRESAAGIDGAAEVYTIGAVTDVPGVEMRGLEAWSS
jgi:phosphoribosylamine--glycine ligase / phosphoribosylformylglycinamidine cyclo-ligase